MLFAAGAHDYFRAEGVAKEENLHARSRTLDEPTDRTDLLWHVTKEVFDEWAAKNFVPIRLIGMAAKSLSEGEGQLSLFPDPQTQRQKTVEYIVGDDVSVRVAGTKDEAIGLLDEGLVDELVLLYSPIVLGEGKKLFPDGFGRHDLKVVESTALSGGLLALRLAPAAA